MKANQLVNAEPTKNFAQVCLAACQKLVLQIEKAKQGILASYRDQLATHEQVLRLALNEAEAIAWQTEFPQLIFPTLAMEKAESVAAWNERQIRLQRNGANLALAV